ncbi:cyclin-G2 isoform X1 [Scleropages formosus]|uniref:cyclin-G2 isoform X1 n=1 Tax=Scleropages formosus TaxID=113540 RepID=UPI0008781085|nr:cyclin-G2-like isoform X1 [Scleropages formosus]XP_029108938.1 cyclin-G2-like isoform X1 [Scleropages formosus]
MEALQLLRQLEASFEQEAHYVPRETGLTLMESTEENHDNRVSAKCRDSEVEQLWSLTSFFGYSTQTFAQAVSLLDRFLAMMKVQPKHLSCIGISCLHIAAKVVEEQCNIPSSHELIRISQCKFTVSDLSRMEKIIAEKLNFQHEAITALTFLQLYHSITLMYTSERKDSLNLNKLEVQLKACLCRLVFSRAKPSVLALSLLTQEIEYLRSVDMLDIAKQIQRHLKITNDELLYWRELVSKCLTEYSSSECTKPNNKKLVWTLSKRTAQHLHASYNSITRLPTIPEGSWNESERYPSYTLSKIIQKTLNSCIYMYGSRFFCISRPPKQVNM